MSFISRSGNGGGLGPPPSTFSGGGQFAATTESCRHAQPIEQEYDIYANINGRMLYIGDGGIVDWMQQLLGKQIAIYD
jgi:hypothetical protein